MTARVRACLLVALLAPASACQRGAAESTEAIESEATVPVRVNRADAAEVRVQVTATGTIAAAPGADLVVSAPESARIASMPYAEGSRVTRGSLLVEFDIPSLGADLAARQSELTQARARLTNARAARERAAGLFERGIAARKEVEDADRELSDATAAVSQAESAVHAARQLQTRRRVVAPFNGIVVRRWRNPGDLVDAGSDPPVLRFADPSRVEVEALVPTADALQVDARQTARVRGPGGVEWNAVVVARPALVDPTASAVRVRLSVVATPPPPLGLPVGVTITVLSKHADVTVPVASVGHDAQRTYVVTVADGVAKRRDVRIGAVGADRVEIVAGLDRGALVVTSGLEGLPDSAHVSVTP
jgi:RND family efflux transporter MFP subunit